jgi:hypothetical protein
MKRVQIAGVFAVKSEADISTASMQNQADAMSREMK